MSAPLILVVEDEPGLLTLFSRLLETVDYQVLKAAGGAEALRLLERESPDLLVLDLAMPEVNGIDVLRELQQMPHLEQMEVLILTARSNKLDQAIALGFSNWLLKPVTYERFLSQVEVILQH